MKKSYVLKSIRDTERTAHAFAELVSAGDTILLSGVVGVGKTAFARALIQARLSEIGALEDVPSPTFTLVQTYTVQDCDIWHADLYRLTHLDEVHELGLESAFEDAICLVEWPDRLSELAPKNALTLTFELLSDEARKLTLEWDDDKWNTVPDLFNFLTISMCED